MMVKLKDICTINPKTPALVDALEVSFVPMPKVGERGEFDPSEIKEYREVKKGFTNFQNGDVLFAKITPCMENGKGAVARALKNGYGFGSTEFHVLRPDCNKGRIRAEAYSAAGGAGGQQLHVFVDLIRKALGQAHEVRVFRVWHAQTVDPEGRLQTVAEHKFGAAYLGNGKILVDLG